MSQSDQGYSSPLGALDPTQIGYQLGQSMQGTVAQGASAVSSLVTLGQILLGVGVAAGLVFAWKAYEPGDALKAVRAAKRASSYAPLEPATVKAALGRAWDQL